MGLWSYYFLGKLLLVAGGSLQAHLLLNLPFALFTALPVNGRGWCIGKQLVAVPIGIALLYHDSRLPPFSRLLEQTEALSAFSADYLLELATRFINPEIVLGLAVLFVALWVLSHKLRLSTLAILGVLVSPGLARLTETQAPPDIAATSSAPGPSRLEEALDAFYRNEQGRKVLFPKETAADTLPYDIVLLHVCSLAWDDLDLAGLREHPLLQRLDLRFSRFSSAASYSGPAAIRVLRSVCGQPAHDRLYQAPDPECLLMNRLSSAGFQPHLAMNHDGRFGNFLDNDVRRLGGVQAPLHPLDDSPVLLRAFDGSPIYDDAAVLEGWWDKRLTLEAPRVALYYNTATLHDGNAIPGAPRLTPSESYRRRAVQMLDGLNRFLTRVEASGRRMVVVLIPEHGANVLGDRLQISGLREIPSPAITQVPAGIALIGAAPGATSPVQHDAPTSHLAIAQLLAQFSAHNPYAPEAPSLTDYAATLVETAPVAENDGVIVFGFEQRWWLRTPDGDWSEYRP